MDKWKNGQKERRKEKEEKEKTVVNREVRE